jgi:hypothetical protein
MAVLAADTVGADAAEAGAGTLVLGTAIEGILLLLLAL